jgi:proteasome lid subunit RPN8/RPN11
MANVCGSDWAYQFDPIEQVAAFQEMDERGEDPLVIYHSHTHTAAVPSGTDTKHAHYPDAHYLIVSLIDPGQPVLRSWRLAGQGAPAPWREEPIEILAQPNTTNQPATAAEV